MVDPIPTPSITPEVKEKLTRQERTKYEKMWLLDKYRERSPGMRFADRALEYYRPHMVGFNNIKPTLLDIGAGTGRVSKFFQECGFDVTALDIASNAVKEFDGPFITAPVWDIPGDAKWDFGFCADLMEHLPEEMVEAALTEILGHTQACYFQIANFHCHEGDEIGEALHLTVKPFDWWMEKMKKIFPSVLAFEEAPKHHIFYVDDIPF